MTNADKVRDICRAIRGVALNYPAGLAAIRAELDVLDPQTVTVSSAWQDAEPATVTVGSDTLPRWIPEAGTLTEAPPKRGPGRPKGSRNKGPIR